jgi:UDP-N-acetylglucosamine 3-dehydrogenase
MNVGIVGCGFISAIHVHAWRDMGLKVTAACDLNEELAKKFTKDLKIPKYYTNFTEMPKNEDLYAISVCVPPKFHINVAIEALQAGCNIVVEKPFTVNAQEAEQLIEALKN